MEGFGPFIAVFAISGGLIIAAFGMWLDGRKRHLRHIERMAMIEKGLAPAELSGALAEGTPRSLQARASQRRSGVFMICLGIGLGILFYSHDRGIQSAWIGAFIAMFGVANLVNALLDERDARQNPPPQNPPSAP